MKRLFTVGLLLFAFIFRVCAEEDTQVAAGTATPDESSTNAIPDDVSTNDVLESLPFVFPIEVDAYEMEMDVSAELNEQFDQLRTAESGATDLTRRILIQSLSEKQGRSGMAMLRSCLAQRAASMNWDDPAAVEEMISLAGCAESLEAFKDCDIPSEVWGWLFSSIERVCLVAQTITDLDRHCEVARIIQELYEHDPQGRDRFLNLILALAVVWDTPRKAMDKQVENGWLPPDEDITLYYDYFKRLYMSDKAKVPYSELSIDSLLFVVDTPTPISELEWALENVDEDRSRWGRLYEEIPYDYTRLFRKQADWPHREYTLKEIEECFGICIDQAYYCVITARAHGIPSLFFCGVGKYSGHAWFGFLRKPDEWEMDIGRSSRSGFAIGFAMHPQKNHVMSDHELEYFSQRALRPDRARKGAALEYLSELLFQEDVPEEALLAARAARKIDPMIEAAWETECNILADTERYETAFKLMDEKADCFEFFPDVVMRSRQRQADMQACSGDVDGAVKTLQLEVMRAASKRTDLQRDMVISLADQLLELGEASKGMSMIEKVMTEQIDNDHGLKVGFLIKEYLRFAQRAGLEHTAKRFLKNYRK